ncbi:MAG TPA: maleylpyruvate isomerase N-terminal domain-containing protein [Vicinamibacterales bacterium]
MSLETPAPIDTRPLFRPVSSGLVTLLRGLREEQWQAPTIAGSWVVRDVVAHLLDSTLRRLSFHRDRMVPPPPSSALNSERDFVKFINDLNAVWVSASRRLSPRVLTDLFDRASGESADWFEALSLDAPALFPVSWAGEQTSSGWFDIGREFTELWHHQQQIRMAVGAASLSDSRYLHAVIDIAARGLPSRSAMYPATQGIRRSSTSAVPAAVSGRWCATAGAGVFTGGMHPPRPRVFV